VALLDVRGPVSQAINPGPATVENRGGNTWLTPLTPDESASMGTGNPGPTSSGMRAPVTPHSDCLIALDADTGKLKMVLQFVPHDVNDIDANRFQV